MKNSGNIPFVSEDVSAVSVVKYIQRCKKDNIGIHAFELYEDNILKIRFAPYPYSCHDTPQIFSLSKSFTSTAVGILCDDGLLSVEDRIVDIFPDKLPETVSENLSLMKIKHVLSMNTGHSSCVMLNMIHSGDCVRSFLAQEVTNKPGSSFVYNTGATCLLGAVVERKTGKTLFDFANERIFKPLGIENVYWDRVDDGTSESGCGLHISCDDIAKFGLLYLNNGVWNGERIISENWVREVSKPHSDNSMNGTPDWIAGYGYQFWRNAKWGYRADGAMGQLCVIVPEKNIVAVQLANIDSMQTEMNAVSELIENLHAGVSEQADIKNALSGFYTPLKSKSVYLDTFGKNYYCNENPAEITCFSFYEENERVILNLSNGRESQQIILGNGEFVQNKIWAKYIKPTLWYTISGSRFENLHFMASYTIEENRIIMQLRYLDNPIIQNITCTFDGDSAVLELSGPIEPKAEKITARVK